MDSSRIPLRRLKKGDQIRATEWNAVVDALSRVELGGDVARGPSKIELDPDIVLLKNESGVALTRFSVFTYSRDSSTIFSPSLTSPRPSFQLHRPLVASVPSSTPSRILPVAIAIEPIAVDGYGRAAVAGVFACQVDVLHESHRFAALKASTTTELVSAAYGPAEMLWQEGTTGVKWAIVRLGSPQMAMVPVKVFPEVGGSWGTDDDPCTITYTVKDFAAQTLGTAMTPLRPRGARGEIAAIAEDSYGVGFWGADGVFYLWDAGETPNSFPAYDTTGGGPGG